MTNKKIYVFNPPSHKDSTDRHDYISKAVQYRRVKKIKKAYDAYCNRRLIYTLRFLCLF